MGCYIYINENDQKSKRVVEDKQINNLLQEALQYDKSLMVSSHSYSERKSIFHKKKKVTFYTLFHEVFDTNGNSIFQAREQFSGSGKKEVVLAYLYGIINGHNTETIVLNQEKEISDLWRIAQKKNCDDFINILKSLDIQVVRLADDKVKSK